jgi:tetratricopeptide (TPR) repeat protein
VQEALDPIFRAAIFAWVRGDWKALVQAGTEYTEIAPDRQSGWTWLGRGYAGKGEYAKATEAYQKSLEIEEDKDIWVELGQAYASHGIWYQTVEKKTDLAERQFQYAEHAVLQALQLDRKLASAISELGVIFYHQRRLNLALDALAEAAKLNPDDLRIWHYLGMTYADNGQPEEAIAAFRRVIDVDPSSLSAWLSLGLQASALGDDELVIDAYKNLRRIEPKMAKVFLEQIE